MSSIYHVAKILCTLGDFLSLRSSPTSIDIFYSQAKRPRSRYTLTCQTYSSDGAYKKARTFQHIFVASRKSVWGSMRNGAGVSFSVALWMSIPVSESKGPYQAPFRAGFSPTIPRSGLLGGRKMRRWRGPLLEKRAFVRWSGILIVTNSARKGSRAEDYPFYITPLILLFMNLASLRERSGRPFCFWTKGVAINMLDCI